MTSSMTSRDSMASNTWHHNLQSRRIRKLRPDRYTAKPNRYQSSTSVFRVAYKKGDTLHNLEPS